MIRGARTCVACLIALLVSAALASAAGNVARGRSYLGTIADGGSTGFNSVVGSPIQITVSADGKLAMQIATSYGVCAGVSFPGGGEQLIFPTVRILHGTFKTTAKPGYKRSSPYYAMITIKGRFLSGGHVDGTIAGATNITPSGGTGPRCATTNPWSATAKPPGYIACDPVSLYDANANYVSGWHTTCAAMAKVIRKGYKGVGVFSAPPGWKCSRNTIKPGLSSPRRGHLCKRQRERFQFVII